VRITVFLVVIALVLIPAAPADAQVRFRDASLTEAGALLFSAESSFPGFGTYQTLFLSDIKTKQTNQFTYFPKEIIYLPAASSLQIQNRFGVFRSGADMKTFTPLSIFPAFVNGYEIEQGKITPIKTSPDGRYLTYFKATSSAFGNLMLFDVAGERELVVSEHVPLSLQSPPVSWSPNSRHFVYSKDFKIFYFSIDHFEKQRVISEKYRLLAEGFLSNVQWDNFGNLYYVSGSLVFRIDSPELFTRGLYSGSVQIGTITGKLPFAFEPNIDRYWISPDGNKLILNKAQQSVFFLYLIRRDYTAESEVKSLPHLALPRSMSLEKVIWSAADQITLLTKGMAQGRITRRIFRLAVPRTGTLPGFTQTADQDVRELVLSEDQTKILVVKSDRVEVLDYAAWRKEADIAYPDPVHAVWKSPTEVVIGGARTVELHDLTKKMSSLIALSQSGASGFTVDGKGLMTRAGDKTYVTGLGRAAWEPTATYNVEAPAAANADYRVYAETIDRGTYANMIMVRDLKGLSTAPLFPFKSFAYEKFPGSDEPADPVYFDHGSRIRRREVAIALNAVTSTEGLGTVLTTLKDYGVRATFFVNGEFIRRFPDACQEIADSGHEVASMFYAYFNMTDARLIADTEYIKKGLARNEDEYFQATGKELSLLWHAPYYFTGSSIIEASKQMNYFYVGRDIDSLDWVGKTDGAVPAGSYLPAAELVERIIAQKKPGSIIPIELGMTVNNRDDYLYQYLDVLLNALAKLGYEVVPVSQLIEHAK
jgi:peptidoglycan/xylan/chitin deacetylase (PgdA/CDA1 family)